MEKTKRGEVIIRGTIDKLVECEFYILMTGNYKESENWNNGVFERGYNLNRLIIMPLKRGRVVEYHYAPRENVGIQAIDFIETFTHPIG